MPEVRTLVLACLGSTFLLSGAHSATLICIQPVPLTIKEMADRQQAGLMSEDAVRSNAEYLTERYCAASSDAPAEASAASLGNGCQMKWGYRLGELVYWATCDEKEEQTTSVTAPLAQQSKQPRSASLLQECLAAYVRRNGRFRPEGTSTGDFKSRSDMAGMCQFAIAHGNYYWRRVNCKNPEMARFCQKDPMTVGR
jgi:hypothetical protein